jgi:molybdate transport system permease protein
MADRALVARGSRVAVQDGRPARWRPDGWSFILAPAALLLLFIALPVAALLIRGAQAPGFWASLRSGVVLEALRLTLATTSITLLLALACGTPLAFLLARARFPGKQALETLVDFPLILPPVVAGVALLMAFGRRGLLGQQLDALGVTLPFSTAAVVMAQLFVAIPFYVRSARVGFAAVDPSIEEAAAMDGAGPWASFRLVTLPVALPAMTSGAVLCFGRAVSEFGATLLFAGNLQGTTQTMSLAIVQAIQTNLSAALAIAVLLVAVSGALLLLARALGAGHVEF